MSTESLLSYYQQNNFNPVPIALDTPSAWQTHLARRRNLYERHLGIPMSLLRERSVIEFGCNSGENALVLASVGANLTLVEPNEQVWPRLRTLFGHYGLEDRIMALSADDIRQFRSDSLYDLVIAEGFLYTLPNRDELLQKLCKLLAPGGRAIISFNDRYGMLMEATKQMLLSRTCQLTGVDDALSNASLELARRLYGADYTRLNASRPFETWWKDTLVNPFVHSAYLWSYPELLALVEKEGAEFCSCSPQWVLMDRHTWYKNVLDRAQRQHQLLEDWSTALPFFLTGKRPPDGSGSASSKVIRAVSDLVAQISEYTDRACSIESILYPPALDQFLSRSGHAELRDFNSELKQLFEAVQSDSVDSLIATYHDTKSIRGLWGAPYHYLCFGK